MNPPKKLEGSEEIYRIIFENSAVAITLADEEERIIAWNPFAAKLLEMDEKDLLHKPVKDFYPAEEWDKVRTCNVRKWGQKQHLETKIINKRGELIDVDIAITVLKDEAGKILGSIGVVSDIRTRKRLTNMLDASVKELADLKAGLDEHAIVAIIDQMGKIIYANDKFCAVSKYTREELVGQDYISFHAIQPAEFMQSLWKAISEGKVWKGEIKNTTKLGDYYWVDTTIVPIIENQSYQYISINTDITQRKKQDEEIRLINRDLTANAKALREMVVDREKAYKELEENQRQMIQVEKMATLGTLAAGFAHEIKNPLGIILQASERIHKVVSALPQSETNLQYVQMVRSAAERANRLVTTILRYSRASQVEANVINVYDVIESSIELVKQTDRRDEVVIETHYTRENEHTLYGDAIMLQQAFFDLMTNSMDAMPEGGKIKISARFEASDPRIKKGAQYVIDVADTGTGIPPEYIDKIFDPFFTTKEEGKGTGLGLSTVYLILERHNGTISVKSKLGEGTVFTITLPVDGAKSLQKEEDDGRQN